MAVSAGVRADDNAVIKGKIVFNGDADKHKQTVLDTSKDPNCKKSKDKIGSWNVILNKGEPTTVRNVLVYVKEGLDGRTFPPPKEPATIDQHGCEYKPHVMGVMEGQEVVIKNSDDTNHNIHFLPKANEEINKTQPKKDMADTVKLTKAEEPFHVKCDVHPWMGAYIGVFKHPFFFVTDKEGTYELKGLPPGKYVVKAWHETFGEQTAEVEVKSGETKEKNFTFEEK
jgi:plastocyanin